MTKRIVVCSDGTGNKGGTGHDTNIWRIYTATAGKESDSQFAIYDDGVGTEYMWCKNFFDRMVGYGVSKNIKDLYRSLCHVYEPGAHIYLFGFSRGAHTIRKLTAFIASQGILNPAKYENDQDFEADINTLYTGYRFKDFGEDYTSLETIYYRIFNFLQVRKFEKTCFFHKNTDEISRIRRSEKLFRSNQPDYWTDYHTVSQEALATDHIHDGELDQQYRVGIRFLGVWDTVDSVGLPVEWMADLWNEYIYRFQFRDYTLCDYVSCAYHALAIDECRTSFTPRPFDIRAEKPNEDTHQVDRANDWQRIHQIWFAGVHSNIGGGYPKQGLAHISLCWIADAAKNHGLIVDDDTILTIKDNQMVSKTNKLYSTLGNPHDKIYNPRSGIWNFYSYQARDISKIHRDYCDSSSLPIIDSSVLARISRRTQHYAPFNLPREFCFKDSSGTQPCSFLGDTDVQDYIKEEWNQAPDDKLATAKNISKSWERQLALIKVLIVVVVISFIVTQFFDVFSDEKGERQISIYWWFVSMLSLVVAHYATDIYMTKKLSTCSSELWSTCIHKVHKKIENNKAVNLV